MLRVNLLYRWKRSKRRRDGSWWTGTCVPIQQIVVPRIICLIEWYLYNLLFAIHIIGFCTWKRTIPYSFIFLCNYTPKNTWGSAHRNVFRWISTSISTWSPAKSLDKRVCHETIWKRPGTPSWIPKEMEQLQLFQLEKKWKVSFNTPQIWKKS